MTDTWFETSKTVSCRECHVDFVVSRSSKKQLCDECRSVAFKRVRVPPERWLDDSRYLTSTGYVYVILDDRTMPEHRYVMEQLLGRPLVKVENVHLVIGSRADIRPENLELWVTVQPYGQRARDVKCPHCGETWFEQAS